LPGVILAICLPQLNVTTIDSNGKKTRFQQQVKIELGLKNLDVQNIRAEECQAEPFDIVISRAFASLEDMINWTAQLCAPQGVFLAMKGQYNAQELSQLPEGYALIASHELMVPGTQGSRHLMEIGRA
ncbi:MAG: 16S rRNA (guanine(527)-N(7))-methyltransferase RsmG, partial [Pseudomonadales bacterium]